MRPTLRVLQGGWARQVTPRTKSIAFIGLGRMGSEMAQNLFSKTHAVGPDTQLVVCDAFPEAAANFANKFTAAVPGAKVTVVSSPEEAVAASGTVVTMLPASAQVLDVYSGERGMLRQLEKLGKDAAQETLFIDSTTLDVNVGRTVAAEAHALGADMVDAPVSGGVTGARAGTLAFLVGGTEASFERARPLLSLMGGRILHCGPSGAGLAAKICNNLVLGVEQIVVAEAMLLGQKLGLDGAVLAQVINSSTGGCWASSVNNPAPGALPEKPAPCDRGYEGGFATALMLKDMGLATKAAAEAGSSLPLAGAAEALYSDTIRLHPELKNKDFSSVYEYLRRASERGSVVQMGPVSQSAT